jgi:antitoxin (DNA-binding transcriptional repressor) of toxin-antitoxin stability system
MHVVPTSEAMATLPDLLDLVEGGEEITITRHGTPVAVMVRPSTLRTRKAARAFEGAAEIGRRLEAARYRPLDRTRGISSEYADELVAWIREGRDARP